MTSTGIVWFRRDQRIHDQPALSAAFADHRTVIPLYVLDPRLLRGRFASSNRTWFLLGSLEALAADLERRGTRLVVRLGDPAIVVPGIAAAVGATDVDVSRDHAPYGRARDRAVADALGRLPSRVWLRSWPGNLVHEPEDVATLDGRPYVAFSPFRRAWARLPRRSLLPAPRSAAGHDLDPGPLPTLAHLGHGDGPTADPAVLPEPGEAAARRRLRGWLAQGVEGHVTERHRLDVAGTSQLSAYLHLGLLSPNEVVELADGSGPGPASFIDQLAWRDFYAHALFHRPGLRRAAFQPRFDTVDWSTDAAALDAWRAGRTGYPIVDAAMRQLVTTGWLPDRARMIAASFLTKDLLVDWRAGEAHFMRHLVDGDVASNNGGWQWSASTGTDPQPYVRVFNPIVQGRRFDPDGAYVRRWVPELRRLPSEHIHAPWQAPAHVIDAAGLRIGLDYPWPIVDHALARARALAAYAAVRRTS